MDGTVGHIQSHDAAAATVFHDQIEGEVLDKELRIILQGLLIERVQDRMSGPVRSSAGALSGAFAVIGGHATKGALVDFTVFGAREGDALMLELDDGGDSLAHHVLNRILITQPVRPLDGVVHMPAPIVLAHVAQCSRNATLCCHGMGARGEDLGDASCLQALHGHAEGGAQTCAAGSDNYDIIVVIDYFISADGCQGQPPSAIAITA